MIPIIIGHKLKKTIQNLQVAVNAVLKRNFYMIMSLSQETREAASKQLYLKPKTTRKEEEEQQQQIVEGNK